MLSTAAEHHKYLVLPLLPLLPQVVAGAPGSRLVDLVVSPQVLVQQDTAKSALRLNATYYITKQVSTPGLTSATQLLDQQYKCTHTALKTSPLIHTAKRTIESNLFNR